MLKTEAPSALRFAVVDLEASSTKPNNRIIEIAVLIFEDNGIDMSLKETYSTLVNPELEVPDEILELTGITAEELEVAPKFFEIAEDLELLTRDCILVAHNVDFDMELLRSEFEKLGVEYNRKTKCTQKLAMKQFPELASYGLKSLCELLDIELSFNHKAMDDAVACSELFSRTYFDQKRKNTSEGPTLTKLHKNHPGLNLSFLAQLTTTPGVVHFNSDGKTIYIDRFENLKEELPRFLVRFAKKYEEAELDDLQVSAYKDSLMAMRKKEELIGKFRPNLNFEERKTSWGVFLKENPFSLRAFPLFKGQGDLLFISDNKDDAVHWIRLQLDDVEKQEFAYIDQQDQRLINRLKKEREKQIRTKVKPFAQYPHDHFVVMGPGRDDDELSCHFFNGGRLSGHAFISGQAAFGIDCTPSFVKPVKETSLLKHYLLREFQDWKNRTRKDHSIKVLKSVKVANKERVPDDANGNLYQDEAPNQRFRKKNKKKNTRRQGPGQTGSSKKKHFSKKSASKNSQESGQGHNHGTKKKKRRNNRNNRNGNSGGNSNGNQAPNGNS